MNSTKGKAESCGSLITLWFLTQVLSSKWNNKLKKIKQQQQLESEQTDQRKWKLIKYEICELAITYSEKISQNTRSQCELEKKLK